MIESNPDLGHKIQAWLFWMGELDRYEILNKISKYWILKFSRSECYYWPANREEMLLLLLTGSEYFLSG